MSNPNYTLEIISHHNQFDNKSLRKYYVDGIETVGAWGNEPFEIRFKNNTWQKVQVKISLDGTDVFTGKPADTSVSKDMWVVSGYGTLSLKAWPETNNGGAQFVFTSGDKSVAVHTHGDLSSRGIIAAAVFTEGHVEPIKLTPPTQQHHHYHYENTFPVYPVYPIWVNTTSGNTAGTRGFSKGMSSNSTFSCDSISYNASSASVDCLDIGDSQAGASLETLVAVGAGQHVDQKITYVTGLTKPVFTETVRVKYLWWDDLVAKLRTESSAKPQPSGFPGDSNQKNIDLKSTPRVEKTGMFRRVEQQQAFNRF
jgi:hypothetical protein